MALTAITGVTTQDDKRQVRRDRAPSPSNDDYGLLGNQGGILGMYSRTGGPTSVVNAHSVSGGYPLFTC